MNQAEILCSVPRGCAYPPLQPHLPPVALSPSRLSPSPVAHNTVTCHICTSQLKAAVACGKLFCDSSPFPANDCNIPRRGISLQLFPRCTLRPVIHDRGMRRRHGGRSHWAVNQRTAGVQPGALISDGLWPGGDSLGMSDWGWQKTPRQAAAHHSKHHCLCKEQAAVRTWQPFHLKWKGGRYKHRSGQREVGREGASNLPWEGQRLTPTPLASPPPPPSPHL